MISWTLSNALENDPSCSINFALDLFPVELQWALSVSLVSSIMIKASVYRNLRCISEIKRLVILLASMELTLPLLEIGSNWIWKPDPSSHVKQRLNFQLI